MVSHAPIKLGLSRDQRLGLFASAAMSFLGVGIAVLFSFATVGVGFEKIIKPGAMSVDVAATSNLGVVAYGAGLLGMVSLNWLVIAIFRLNRYVLADLVVWVLTVLTVFFRLVPIFAVALTIFLGGTLLGAFPIFLIGLGTLTGNDFGAIFDGPALVWFTTLMCACFVTTWYSLVARIVWSKLPWERQFRGLEIFAAIVVGVPLGAVTGIALLAGVAMGVVAQLRILVSGLDNIFRFGFNAVHHVGFPEFVWVSVGVIAALAAFRVMNFGGAFEQVPAWTYDSRFQVLFLCVLLPSVAWLNAAWLVHPFFGLICVATYYTLFAMWLHAERLETAVD
jgi:hypothetical protein